MNASVTVTGVVGADGTLQLEGRVPLPAGRVQVTVQPLPELPADDPFWQRMQAIWSEQEARGVVPRGAAEIEAERAAARDEWEERAQEIERLQAEGRAARGAARDQGS